MAIIKIPTNYYQHFDADFNRDVPAEGYGGWKKANLPLNTECTALAVMHAWDCGTREQYPGWHRAVEYIPRSYKIVSEEFPKILGAVRQAGMKIVHIVSKEDYCRDYPGYKMVKELADKYTDEKQHTTQFTTQFSQANQNNQSNQNNQNNQSNQTNQTNQARYTNPGIIRDEVAKELYRFRHANVFPGEHNVPDIQAGQSKMTFAKGAEPIGNEAIAKDSVQLLAYCKEYKINHLIYIGFAIDGCLLVSPGGMIDMSRQSIICSTIKQAVTAIENKETAREELCKQVALWRVALLFGFVYDSDDFVNAISRN